MKNRDDNPDLRSFLAASGISPETFLQALDILREELRRMLSARPAVPDAAPLPAPASHGRSEAGAEEDAAILRALDAFAARWDSADAAVSEVPSSSAAQAEDDLLRTVVKPRGAGPPAAPPPEAPPAAASAGGRDAARITTETVILRPPSSPREAPASPGRPPVPPGPAAVPPDDQPTGIRGVEQAPAATQGARDALLETVVRIPKSGPAARPEDRPPAPPGTAGRSAEDDLLATVVRTPGRGPVGPPGPAAPPAAGKDRPPVPPPAGAAEDEDDLGKTVILRPGQVKGKGKGDAR